MFVTQTTRIYINMQLEIVAQMKFSLPKMGALQAHLCIRVTEMAHEPRHNHVVCTLQVAPLTSPVLFFVLMQDPSLKDIAESDILR